MPQKAFLVKLLHLTLGRKGYYNNLKEPLKLNFHKQNG